MPPSANRCSLARSLNGRPISRNSRSARSASESSKGRSCRHCSDRRKSRAGRNSASRHHIHSNSGPDRCTRDAGSAAPIANSQLSGRKVEGCCSGADGSPGGSRNRASAAVVVYEPTQPALRPAAVSGRWQSTNTEGATYALHRRFAVGRRFKSECMVHVPLFLTFPNRLDRQIDPSRFLVARTK